MARSKPGPRVAFAVGMTNLRGKTTRLEVTRRLGKNPPASWHRQLGRRRTRSIRPTRARVPAGGASQSRDEPSRGPPRHDVDLRAVTASIDNYRMNHPAGCASPVRLRGVPRRVQLN